MDEKLIILPSDDQRFIKSEISRLEAEGSWQFDCLKLVSDTSGHKWLMAFGWET